MDLKVASVQFESKNGDKSANLAAIARIAAEAARQNVKVVVFHECCIPGYTFARDLDRDDLELVAETIPGSSL